MLPRVLRPLAALSLLLVLIACGGGVPLPRAELHDAIAAGQTLSIRNVSGEIRVTAAREGALRIVAQGASDGSRPERVRIVSRAVGSGLAVCALWGNATACDEGAYSPSSTSFWQRLNFRSPVSVNFTVELPAGVKLDIRDVNGSVTVDGATSDVLVHAVNGSVRAATTSGILELKTVNGDVTGDVRGAATRILAKTVNGTVDMTGPADLAGEIEMGAVNGALTSDFAINTVGKLSKRKLAGRIGTGGGSVELKSVNGSVALHKRA